MRILIAEKVGMTQTFDDAGNAVGVTVLKVFPSKVLRLRTEEKDGYEAMQVGAGDATKKSRGKSVLGQGNGEPYRLIAEFPKSSGDVKAGTVLGIEQLTAGELVNVVGISKGKGFAGTVKRHNFNTGPKTHGSRNYRRPGSIGGTGASRVFPGQKMPGRMGAEQVTTRNLTVFAVDTDEQAVLVKGGVPGPNGRLVVIKALGAPIEAPAPEQS